MNTHPEESTFERVKQSIVDMLGCDEKQVTPTARFHEDLSTDSLDDVELVMAWEEDFNVMIDDDEAENLSTVQSVVDLIDQKIAAR